MSPEGVPVVPGPCQPLGRDRAPLSPCPRLKRVEERETDGLLQLRIAFQLDVGTLPEVVEVRALGRHEPLPPRVPCLGERRGNLVAERRRRAAARPAVGEELDDAEPLARFEVRGDRDPAEVAVRLGNADIRSVRPVHHVVHRRGEPEPASPGGMDQHDLRAQVACQLRLERCLDRGGRARVVGGLGHRLVRDELRLHDEPRRRLERLDLVADRGHGALDERDEPLRGDAHALARGRAPVGAPAQQPGAEVEHAFVGEQLAEADVERLVVDQEPHDLPVRDVHDHLTGLRVAVARFGVRQRALLVEAVQVRPGEPVRLALVEVAAEADVPVRKREHRSCLGEDVQVQLRLAQRPGIDRERGVVDHGPSSSPRSETTTSAPWARSSSA